MTGDLSEDSIVAAVERRCLLYGGVLGPRLGSDKERLQVCELHSTLLSPSFFVAFTGERNKLFASVGNVHWH